MRTSTKRVTMADQARRGHWLGYSDHRVRFSTPAPWPALSYSQRHGRCNLMGGAMPISRSAVRFLGSIFLDRVLPRSGATHPTHGTRLSLRQRPTGEGV